MKKIYVFVLASLFCVSAFAETATSQGILDSVLGHFVSATTGQMTIAQGFGRFQV